MALCCWRVSFSGSSFTSLFDRLIQCHSEAVALEVIVTLQLQSALIDFDCPDSSKCTTLTTTILRVKKINSNKRRRIWYLFPVIIPTVVVPIGKMSRLAVSEFNFDGHCNHMSLPCMYYSELENCPGVWFVVQLASVNAIWHACYIIKNNINDPFQMFYKCFKQPIVAALNPEVTLNSPICLRCIRHMSSCLYILCAQELKLYCNCLAQGDQPYWIPWVVCYFFKWCCHSVGGPS